MSIHKDHRQRVKDRFLKEGLENFDDLHILELMLFYCIPRRDTNIIAHNLLDRFGSLPNVLDATHDQLKKVEGMGSGAATFIRFLSELERVSEIRRNGTFEIVNSTEDVGKCFMAHLGKLRNESVYIMCLDAKNKVLSVEKVCEGSVTSVNVPMRAIIERAIATNATAMILAHNHPSGLAFPSEEDIKVTYDVAKNLQGIDVMLLDHMVISDGDYISMVQSGQYYPGVFPGEND